MPQESGLPSGVPGDAEFEAFYRRMAPTAERYARTILGRRASDVLDDALQSAWSNAWRRWSTAEDERREAWMLRIVRNCCLDLHRRHRSVEPAPGGGPPSAEEVALERAHLEFVYALLGRLGPTLREALWLREVAGLSYAEIAELQEVPVGTVMSRLYTARRRAARLLRRSR